MNLARWMTLAAMIIAICLIILVRFLEKQIPLMLKKYLQYAGIIYLSVTVFQYFLIRIRPNLPVKFVILSESIALFVHLLTCFMLTVVVRRFSKIQSDNAQKSDIESE
jgi:cytochrome b561